MFVTSVRDRLNGRMVVTIVPAVFARADRLRLPYARFFGRSTTCCALDNTRFPMGRRCRNGLMHPIRNMLTTAHRSE
jgi:hypothetical protein